MAKSLATRKADLIEAKKRFARSKKLLSLDELAILYGLSKGAFVNLRKMIPDFPDPAERKSNAYFYPAHAAVSALLAYVTRHEETQADHARRLRALAGPPQDLGDGDAPTLTANEQLKAYDLRQKLKEEAIEQGHLHRSDHCAAVSERVFSLISRTFGKPSDSMDPNGRWPAAVRAQIDKAGEALVLQCYNQMRDMLGQDANQQPRGSSTARAGRRRAKPLGKARKS